MAKFPQIYSDGKKKLNKGFITEILGKQFRSGISPFSNVVHKGKYWQLSSTVRNLEYLTRRVAKGYERFQDHVNYLEGLLALDSSLCPVTSTRLLGTNWVSHLCPTLYVGAWNRLNRCHRHYWNGSKIKKKVEHKREGNRALWHFNMLVLVYVLACKCATHMCPKTCAKSCASRIRA